MRCLACASCQRTWAFLSQGQNALGAVAPRGSRVSLEACQSFSVFLCHGAGDQAFPLILSQQAFVL
jgi:hypothetical protein